MNHIEQLAAINMCRAITNGESVITPVPTVKVRKRGERHAFIRVTDNKTHMFRITFWAYKNIIYLDDVRTIEIYT